MRRHYTLTIPRICLQCGTEFKTTTHHAAQGWGKFCSRSCHHEYQKHRVTLVCPTCGKEFEVRQPQADRGRKYCSRACYRKPVPIKKKLLDHRHIDPATGCWTWCDPAEAKWRPQTQFRGRTYPVARLSAHIWLGMPLDSPLYACHHCDNPTCFNPEHLFLGTAAENTADMVRKGRVSRSSKVFGEKHYRAKLSEDSVREIWKRLKAGESQTRIAADYSVTPSAINSIARGETWRHITHLKPPLPR